MAFTYDKTKLGEDKLNHLRFILQDTVDAGHYLEDEEIEFVLSQQPNVNLAAAQLARIIAAALAKLPEIDDPVLKINPKERAKQYMELAKSFDAEWSRAGKSPDADSPSESFDSGFSLFGSPGTTSGTTFTRDMDFS